MKNILTIPETETSEPEKKSSPPPTPQKIICSDCGKEIIDLKKPNGYITEAVKIKEYSEKEYKRCLCWTCQKKQSERNKINMVA